jgi:putative membrane protein
MRQLVRLIIYTALYVTVATWLNIHYLKNAYNIDTVFFSLVGVILSLFLVFRLNTGYDRWWQGRQAWGKLVNDARTLALQLNTIIPSNDKKRRKYFSRHISNFCSSLVWHLRDEIDSAKYILEAGEELEDITRYKHQPNGVAIYIFNEVEAMYKSGGITDFDKQQTKTLAEGFIDVLGICERIKNTPIPFSHSAFIKIFIMIYLFILPFGLANTFEYLTIPAVLVMAFAMLGIEVITEEIEQPFGMDANDLPTGQLAMNIRDDVYEILGVEMEVGHKVATYVRKEAEILH